MVYQQTIEFKSTIFERFNVQFIKTIRIRAKSYYTVQRVNFFKQIQAMKYLIFNNDSNLIKFLHK